MEQNGSSNPLAVCGKVSFLTMMLFVGLLFAFIASILVYWTYQAVIGAMVFCTLWIDIPGRVAIFIICYYAAGTCGYFPLPERYRLEWFPEPFMLWRYQSWRQLFRNLFYRTPSTNLINRPYINTIDRSDSSEASLFHGEYEERFYECDPIIRRRSAPVRINYPDSYINYDYISPSEPTGNESPDLSKDRDEPFMSFDSPICGQIVPMIKGKSSKARYLSDFNKQVQESTKTMTTELKKQGAAKVSLTEAKANEQKETAVSNRQEKQKENNPQLSGDTGYPIYPRFPWGFLRIPGGTQIARKIHKRNLKFETREIERYNKEQKQIELEKFFNLIKAYKAVRRETYTITSKALRDIGALTGTRPRTEFLTVTGNVDHTANPLDGAQRETARNIVATGDSVMAPEDIGVLTGARPRCGLFAGTGNIDATANPLDVKQRAKNIDTDSTVNRRRQLPSQRLASKGRSRSHCHNRTSVENLQKTEVEIQGKDDYNISKTRSGNTSSKYIGPMFPERLYRVGQKKTMTDAECLEGGRRLCLKRMQKVDAKRSRDDTDILTMSDDQHNFDIKVAVQTTEVAVQTTEVAVQTTEVVVQTTEVSEQTTEVANRSIDAPAIPANSSHPKTPEKPHYEISVTSLTDAPKNDDSDSNSKDFQKL